MTRTLSIFGATGSVGQSTLDLVRRNREAWDIVALTANGDVPNLVALAREFRPRLVVCANPGCPWHPGFFSARQALTWCDGRPEPSAQPDTMQASGVCTLPHMTLP